MGGRPQHSAAEFHQYMRRGRGSHIVTKNCLSMTNTISFHGTHRRITIAIPYETELPLIGTNPANGMNRPPIQSALQKPRVSLSLCLSRFQNAGPSVPIFVWAYSSVRPLYDDSVRSVTATPGGYRLMANSTDAAPILNVFVGKISTYCRRDWTAGVAFSAGDQAVGVLNPAIC